MSEYWLEIVAIVLCGLLVAIVEHFGEEIGDAFGSLAGRKIDPKSYGIGERRKRSAPRKKRRGK